MKIHSKDFRLSEGGRVELAKWPTKVEPFYKSKQQYHKMLEDHVGRLSESATAAVCLQPPRRAADLPGHGRGREGRCHQARHVGGQSARLPGLQLQAPERHGTAARFSLAHHARSAGTRADRHLQPVVLRGGADRARAPGDSSQRRDSRSCDPTTRRSGTDRYRSIVDLERHLHGNGTRIIKFFLHLSKEEQRQRFLAAHRRARKELEVQPGRHRRSASSGDTT